MKNVTSTRREFLTGAALAAVGLAAGPSLLSAAPREIRPARRSLRIAHLTDMHVSEQRKDSKNSVAGFTAALRHAHAQPDRPDLIMFGGDLVWDSLKTEKEQVLHQWSLWQGVVRSEVKVPWHACLGNHDVWGWALNRDEVRSDPMFGKRIALDQLGVKDRFYSFDQENWHIVVLDSMQIDPHSPGAYMALLDDPQMEWLAKDLAAVPADRHVIVFSHIPILAASIFMSEKAIAEGHFSFGGGIAHKDVKRLKDLFHRHRQVKACVSGHIHLVDEIHYLGVRYFCNGAVSGGWWKGPHQEFPPAYSLIDLYEDGSIGNTIVPYETAPV